MNGGEFDESPDLNYDEGDTAADIIEEFDKDGGMHAEAIPTEYRGCYNDCGDGRRGSVFGRKIAHSLAPNDCFAQAQDAGFKFAALYNGK